MGSPWRSLRGSSEQLVQVVEQDVVGEGSYFPAPVKAVSIPKSGGRLRVLGVLTIADRIARTVVAMVLKPNVEPVFHDDSYGYRLCKSALDAVEVCKQRCWRRPWVVDLDIQGFSTTCRTGGNRDCGGEAHGLAPGDRDGSAVGGVTAGIKLPVTEMLPDGSYLSVINSKKTRSGLPDSTIGT
jgi:hypothetical protein